MFVESWDDEGARKGWCLYKMGCRGPMTYNACSSMRWNDGCGFPISAGAPCIGCAEDGFWDNGPFYQRLSNVIVPGIESTPDQIGKTLTVIAGAGVAAHLTSHLLRKTGSKAKVPAENETGGQE
jgi:hydrogenase small subunit